MLLIAQKSCLSVGASKHIGDLHRLTGQGSRALVSIWGVKG
jgi:hypothetical protein